MWQVGGGERKRMRKTDVPAFDRYVRWQFWLKSCLVDSLLPAAPANEVWWRGDSGRFVKVGGLAWGCLGVVVSGVAAGGGLGFGILGCCLVVPAEAGCLRGLVGERGRTFRTKAWRCGLTNVDERFVTRDRVIEI